MTKGVYMCKSCHKDLCAKRVSLFSSLDDEQLIKVLNLVIHKTYKKGEVLILEGQPFNSLVIINRGQVKGFRTTIEGKEQILYIFSDGDFFGEKNLLRNQPSGFTVEALEQTHVCLIEKSDFQTLVQEYPDIALRIMEELSSRLDHLEKVVESMGTKTVDSRISSVLLEFANKFGTSNSKGTLIELPLSREGIANYIGITRETVSRKMSILQDEGVLEIIGNKKLLILDRSALERAIE